MIDRQYQQSTFTHVNDTTDVPMMSADVKAVEQALDVDAISAALMSLCDVQQHVSGHVPTALDGSRETLAIYLHALAEEVHEVGRAAGWQPWREDRGSDTVEIIKEFSDVLAFVGILLKNLSVRTGVPESTLTREIALRYHQTSLNNVARLSHHKIQSS